MENVPSLNSLTTFFDKNATLVVRVALVVAYALVAIWMFRKLFTQILLISKLDNSLVGLVSTVVDVLLKFFVLVYALQALKVSTTSLVAVLSAVGLAVGLAIQDSIANVMNGLIMIGTKPFKIGDYVKIGEDEGTVAEVRVMDTILNTVDNRQVILPNKTVFNSRIINYDKNALRRIDSVFTVDYDTDVEQAKKIIRKAILSCPLVCDEPEPIIRLQDMGDSSLDFITKCWTKKENYWDSVYDLQETVYKALLDNDIEVPFPQMTLSYRKGEKAPRRKAKEA